LFFLFFTTTPPPPNSTLFPYTTLFRSLSHAARHARRTEQAGIETGSCPDGDTGERAGVCQVNPRTHRAPNGIGALCGITSLQTEDRKSTRLNSSHLVISYAVFCLKKKK